MSTIDAILWLLKDGRWHDLEEITKRIALPKLKTELAVSFLAEYDFIQLNKNSRRIKLKPATLEFIEELQQLEKENLTH
jgi:DNA-binding IclR family transcriptional regulator